MYPATAVVGTEVSPAPEPENEEAVTAPETAKEVRVPTDVRLDAVTFEAKVFPVRLPAAFTVFQE